MALYTDPDDQASQTLEQIPGTITPYYQPYINAGQQSMGALGNQYSQLIGNNYSTLQNSLIQMLTNPAGVMSSIGSNYQESPGYQWELDQSEAAGENAAAAGGYSGTPQDQQFQEQTAEGLADQDFSKYMKTALGVSKEGLKGMGQMYGAGLRGTQKMNQMGYDASNQLAQGLAQYLTQLSQMQYSSQINENMHNMGMLGDAVGLLSNILGDFAHPRSSFGNTKGGSGSSSGGSASSLGGDIAAIASFA